MKYDDRDYHLADRHTLVDPHLSSSSEPRAPGDIWHQLHWRMPRLTRFFPYRSSLKELQNLSFSAKGDSDAGFFPLYAFPEREYSGKYLETLARCNLLALPFALCLAPYLAHPVSGNIHLQTLFQIFEDLLSMFYSLYAQ